MRCPAQHNLVLPKLGLDQPPVQDAVAPREPESNLCHSESLDLQVFCRAEGYTTFRLLEA